MGLCLQSTPAKSNVLIRAIIPLHLVLHTIIRGLLSETYWNWCILFSERINSRLSYYRTKADSGWQALSEQNMASTNHTSSASTNQKLGHTFCRRWHDPSLICGSGTDVVNVLIMLVTVLCNLELFCLFVSAVLACAVFLWVLCAPCSTCLCFIARRFRAVFFSSVMTEFFRAVYFLAIL